MAFWQPFWGSEDRVRAHEPLISRKMLSQVPLTGYPSLDKSISFR